MDSIDQKKVEKPSYVAARRKSFYYAFRGLRALMTAEPNAWIHLVATLVVLVLGWVCSLSAMEWTAILLVTGLVWVAELFNTCVEKILDLLHPERDVRVGLIKDVAAAAVLCAAFVAAVIGCIVFFPHFIR